jgi:hypothetical protein
MLLFGHIGITLGNIFWNLIFCTKIKAHHRSSISGDWSPPAGLDRQTTRNDRLCIHHFKRTHDKSYTGILYNPLPDRLYIIYDKRRGIMVLTLATGSFFHLIEDQMWATPQTLFWPLFGWSFPKDSVVDTLGFLLMLLKKSFIPEFSSGFIPTRAFIPEVIGMVVIVILAMSWLKERLQEVNSKAKKDPKSKKIG